MSFKPIAVILSTTAILLPLNVSAIETPIEVQSPTASQRELFDATLRRLMRENGNYNSSYERSSVSMADMGAAYCSSLKAGVPLTKLVQSTESGPRGKYADNPALRDDVIFYWRGILASGIVAICPSEQWQLEDLVRQMKRR